MLDPQAQALIDLMISKGIPPAHLLTPQEARKAYVERRFFSQPDPEPVSLVQERSIPGSGGSIAARIYRPIAITNETVLPVLVYFHGGGHVIGDMDTHDSLCRQLCNRSGCAIVSVDYRLAPEHRFPAAFDDCVAATAWVHAQARELRVDPTRIAVGGDSAGGQLAATVAIAMRDADQFSLAFQLLIYPVTNMHEASASVTQKNRGYVLTKESLDYYYGHYVPESQDRRDWRISPLLAPSHANLPPALVLLAGEDPLVDEGRAYADKLSSAGVATQVVCFERQIHGFLPMGRIIDEANTAVALCAGMLKHTLAGVS